MKTAAMQNVLKNILQFGTNFFYSIENKNSASDKNKTVLPGTDTKNLTASLWPWNDSWACAIEQYGIKVPGVTLSVWVSLYTLTIPPGRPPLGPLDTVCLLPEINSHSVLLVLLYVFRALAGISKEVIIVSSQVLFAGNKKMTLYHLFPDITNYPDVMCLFPHIRNVWHS